MALTLSTLEDLTLEVTEEIHVRASPDATFEALLEEISFGGMELKKKTVRVDTRYVRQMLGDVVKDQDLSRYIL